MQAIKWQGKEYKSLSEFCRREHLPYYRLVRLCRRYVKAKNDPTVAAMWHLGLLPFDPQHEKLTWCARKDRELCRIRNERYRIRKQLGRKKEAVLSLTSSR